MSISINHVDLNVSRLPLIRPFGFKGSYYTEKWICQVTLRSANDREAVGAGGLAVLWSDENVFAEHTEIGGNLLMVNILEYALQESRNIVFDTPGDLLDQLIGPTYAYAQKITGRDNLRKTFVLNALVSLDNAAWLLYAQEKDITTFDDLIPEETKISQSCSHRELACIPLITYNLSLSEIENLVQQNHFFLKIKIGAPGDNEQMLADDKKRLEAIHQCVGSYTTPYTTDGRIRYYLDANGRYPNKQLLTHLVDHADQIGMLNQISILEEPFNEHCNENVHDLSIRVAADESLHDPDDVIKRAELGYKIIALKPAGKTMTLTFRMLTAASQSNLSCFVADSTCPPSLVEWNKNVAARLAPLPEVSIGLLESNGSQFFKNWNTLVDALSCANSDWTTAHNGIFELGDSYYRESGGIFSNPRTIG